MGQWIWDHNDTYTVNLTECSDQNNPSVPEASEIVPTSEEIRNPEWTILNRITDERQIIYPVKSAGYCGPWGTIATDAFIDDWGGYTPGPTPGPGGSDLPYYDSKIEMPESGKIDFLYTADIHVGWKNWGSTRWDPPLPDPSVKIFSLDYDQIGRKSLVGGDVKAYQNKLIAADRPTYLLDCGDWSKSSQYGGLDEQTAVNKAIDTMKGMGYFGITSGNWEFKWTPISTAFNYLNKLKDHGMMACNVNDSNGKPIYAGGINSEFPGCKVIKVGDKKIAVIAVGYPSPNGFDTYGDAIEYNAVTYRWNYKEGGVSRYRFFDSSNNASLQQNRTVNPDAGGSVYRRVQEYIDKLKGTYGFDYIIVFSHMDKYSDENYSDDSRFFSRADFTIMNTSGINVLIPGHLNAPITRSYPYTWKNGRGSGIVAPEAGGTMNSFGRLEIDLNSGIITAKLLTKLEHLNKIDINDIIN